MNAIVKPGILILLVCSVSQLLRAQSYFAVRNDGQLPKGYVLDKIYESGKSVLMSQPANNIMSAKGQIPFAFHFYGNTYTSYLASDNGYITFNTSASSQLPDSALPANSIVAFWQDFKLQQLPSPNEGIGVQIFSYTLGQAPNRRHVIQYYGLTLASDLLLKPITNASIYAFAIILYEGNEGRYDISFSPYGNSAIEGAIGCSNADNSDQVMVADTLVNLPLQFSFELDQFIVYQFINGVQSDYDLVINTLDLGKIYPVNSIVNFSGRLSNWGKKPVNSFYMNYAINGGDSLSVLVDGLNLLPNGEGSISFKHPVSWLSGTAGSLNDVNFWLSLPNDMPDGISVNSNITRKVLRNNNHYTGERNILFEEATGAWCGYCPDAHLILKAAVKEHGSRIIPVSYHVEDSMSTADGNTILATYVTSYPDAILDRKVFLGSNSTWLSEVKSRLNGNTPVTIYIEEKNYNEQTREITYRIRAKFSDYWYGNLRLGSIVTENNVRGIASPNIWSQYNYYSKEHSGGVGGASHPLYNEKEYMDGYIHQSVVRSMPSGPWGLDGLMPVLVSPNAEYSADFTFVLPPATFVSYETDNNTPYCSTVDLPGQDEGWNIPANINLIGFVAEYDETDIMNRPVINAGQKRLWDLDNSLQKTGFSLPGCHLYPNPASESAYVKLDLQFSGDVALEITDISGKVICHDLYAGLTAGENILFIRTSTFPAGLYSLRISDGGGIKTLPLSIIR